MFVVLLHAGPTRLLSAVSKPPGFDLHLWAVPCQLLLQIMLTTRAMFYLCLHVYTVPALLTCCHLPFCSTPDIDMTNARKGPLSSC
jgi:hypothetical protein